ncbi:MAG: potassium channel family protein [Actinomycetota bacterium]
MYVVIAGAGRVGGRLAAELSEEGHDVVVIDHSSQALDELGKAFNGLALEGEAYDVDVLNEARLKHAEFFCAVTDDDNINLMAAEVAKAVFGVRRVLARLQDPAREDSYRALGIPYISTTKLISSVILEKITSEEFDLHITFDSGEVEVVEFTVGPRAEGMSVGDLEVEGALRVAAVRRGRNTAIPGPDYRLAAGDLLVAAAHHGFRSRVEPLLEEAG